MLDIKIFRITLLLILFRAVFEPLQAQPDTRYNSSEIREAIRKLNVLGSVLYIAAHPDDENTRLITYFSKEKLYNTAYLSLTRGDGGQNLIGPELNELLGVIRTQELLEARKIDGGKQFFSRADDFGFSKNPDETFQVWDREQVLSDMVWVIRKFRPDVLITRFNTEPGKTHGHHTASAILAEEAFTAAADPKRFPAQLKYVEVWQPKRLLWNTTSWFFANPADFKTDTLLKIDVGAYNKSLGKSYSEIAAASRSMHKSQGFGSSGTRGSSIEYLQPTKGPKANNDIFEDINTRWTRVQGGEKIEQALQQIYNNYKSEDPAASVNGLLEVHKQIAALPDSYWKQVKQKELEGVIKACLGLWTEAVAADFSAVPGENVKVTTEVINRSSIPVTINKISWQPAVKDSTLNLALKENNDYTFSSTITLPRTLTYSQPYWLREPQTTGMFTVSDQLLRGLPENPPAVEVVFTVEIKGQSIEYKTPLVYKKTDPVKGEQYRPFEVTPAVFINPGANLFMFADTKPKTLPVQIKAGRNNVSGTLQIKAPAGWRTEPASIPFSLGSKGSMQSYEVKIYPSTQPMQGKLQFKAIMGADTSSDGVATISYDHIPAQTLFPHAVVNVNRIDLQKKGEQIGYIMGAGDEVPAALEQVGYKVTILNDKPVNAEVLKKYDAIVTGIRAYNTTARLKEIQPLLLDYVKNGGTLVVQYNTVPNRITADAYVTDSIGPYPFKLSRDRVTKEDSPVKLLDPKHPLLNVPNKITEEDFKNWVQERGLYFPNEWSKQYQPILSFTDPGEPAKEGSILYAKYGKGVFIYTGISWFRELPEGVSGAYRLFVNLLSAGNEKK